MVQVNYGRALFPRKHHQSKKPRSKGLTTVECVAGPVVKIFDVEDPRGARVSLKSSKGEFDVNMAWALLRQDVLYLDWKARQDVLAIVAAHDKVSARIDCIH